MWFGSCFQNVLRRLAFDPLAKEYSFRHMSRPVLSTMNSANVRSVKFRTYPEDIPNSFSRLVFSKNVRLDILTAPSLFSLVLFYVGSQPTTSCARMLASRTWKHSI